jgi:hypothetical protein
MKHTNNTKSGKAPAANPQPKQITKTSCRTDRKKGSPHRCKPNDQTKFATYTRDSATLPDYADKR